MFLVEISRSEKEGSIIMANKKMMHAAAPARWLEVAPSPLVFPQKPSHHNYPKLETIREDRAEGLDAPNINPYSCSAKSYSH